MGPTDKQISYTLSLLEKAGYGSHHMSARFRDLGAGMRDRSGTVESWLRKMTRAEASSLITRLQAMSRKEDA